MKRQRGYSLLEVIVAFALLALALTLLLGSLSGASRQVGQSDLRTRAVLHAQSLLEATGIDAPLQPGQTHGEWEDGRYRWQLQVEPFVDARGDTAPSVIDPAAPRLARITLQVRWGDGGGETLQWRSLRLLPPATAAVPGAPR
ncbi:type II secretion system protein XpsI [Stenotrophomonas maltophilia]|jgi:general secretion pathway protein I|uniref:Prepilin-type N-terminal cleavage/methylation domain-containing protein n=1 Tax=Stenotrophomonas maltophilia TaxID=40324 RepID=A0A4S2D396_STEMA|nr:prepilin-type N-terminal cleavage/methylation domain-containing protein [Stenotrophomonas maltophilia]TGY35899.1 prepilin-type N-terminal cleavage/methylation domain-containing protein [Stenotrophomonas maltophilia]